MDVAVQRWKSVEIFRKSAMNLSEKTHLAESNSKFVDWSHTSRGHVSSAGAYHEQ